MDFQGFQNTIPTLVIILICIALILISWFSYKKLKSISPLMRSLLITLRASALLIILLLFLNPYFFSSESVPKNPRLLFLLDDSESMSINKGNYEGVDTYQEVISELNLTDNSGLDIEYFTIGSESRQISGPDSLRFLDTETNFTKAVSQIQELEDEFDAAVLISDGIITFGRNPSIQASNLSIPMYTIGLGDTSQVKDITISNLVSNPVGYTDTRHPVSVDISQNGFSAESVSVTLFDSGGNVLETKQVEFNSDNEIQTIDFEIGLTNPGLKQYSIQVQALSNEWNTENNSENFSIDVSDSKINILHIAFEVHPDVSVVRDILSYDKNIELETLTWISGNRFIEQEIPDMSSLDMVILHGLPGPGFNISFLEPLRDIPSLYINLPKTRSTRNSELSEFAFINNVGNQLFELGLVPQLNNTDHPVMELPEVNYENLAPVFSSLRTVTNAADVTTLFNSGFQGLDTPNILVGVLERGSLRRAEIAAWGWYRQYQSTNEMEREFVTKLISNLTLWVSNDPDNRMLKVSPSKSAFGISEQVIINANLNNESGEAESDASIEISIRSQQNEPRSFNMKNEGQGSYKLEINSLAPGLYSYTATARKGDRNIDEQTGEFLIEDSNTELVNTIRDDELLSTLATETGGTFYPFGNMSTFWSDLDADGILQVKNEQVESYTFPVRNIFWFIIVLLLLGTEWVLRKYFSLP